jgi:hypothetical protein
MRDRTAQEDEQHGAGWHSENLNVRTPTTGSNCRARFQTAHRHIPSREQLGVRFQTAHHHIPSREQLGVRFQAAHHTGSLLLCCRLALWFVRSTRVGNDSHVGLAADFSDV